MHELSIVMSIVDIADQQVRKAGARRVDRIDLTIGELAGVEFSALDFAWEAGVRDTVLAGAERHIHRVPGRARCMDCHAEFEAGSLFQECPNCGEYLSDIIGGKELSVKSLIVS